MDMEKVTIAGVGAIAGWFLKEIREYVARHSESHNALYLLHTELSSIRASTVSAQRLFDEAMSSQDRKRAETQEECAFSLLTTLPQIRVFDEKYDALSRTLTDREKEMARYVVSYYNTMRQSLPKKKPDLTGVLLFEKLTSARCQTTKPFAWTNPKETARAKATAREAADEFFREMQHAAE